MTTVTLSKRPGATFTGIEDTYFVEFSSTKYDTAPQFRVGGSNAFGRTHTLIKFTSLGTDLVGPVTVNSVSFELVTNSDLTGAPVCNFYQVLVSNVLAQSDWFQRLTAGPVNWTNQGALGTGDTSATLLGAVSPVAVYTAYTLTAENFRALVEGWINGTISNFGMLGVSSIDLDPAEAFAGFQSSEGFDDGAYPQLTIDYTAGGGTPPTTPPADFHRHQGPLIQYGLTR